jgi:hypothetical protein
VKKTNKVKKYLLKEFQKSLVDISVWSKELLRNEHTRFENAFSIFNKVVAKIFDLQMGMHGKKTSPIDSVDFLHQCYLNIARSIWKQPFLVYDVGVDKIVVQKNKLKVEKIISDCIRDTFDHFLPFDDDNAIGNDIGTVADRDAEAEVHDDHIQTHNQSIEQWEEDTVYHPEEQVEQHEPFTEFEEECASTISVDDINDINDTNETHHETESCKDDFEEQYSLEEESVDVDIDNDDLYDEASTDMDALSDNEDNVVIQPDTQHLPDVQNTQDTFETFDTQFTQGAPDTPDVQDVHSDFSVVKLDENESNNIPQTNKEFNNTHELTEQNLKTIDLQPFHTNHVHPSTDIITPRDKPSDTPTDTPRDNVKIVTYDEKAGKVKSLLSLKKKVKSSMLNTHIQNPSFF